MKPKFLLCLSISSLISFVSLCGMDRPDHHAHLTTPEKVRVQLYHAVHRTIEGEDAPFDPAKLSPEHLQKSPRSFTKVLREKFETPIQDKLSRMGVTRELVADLLPEAALIIQEQNSKIRAKLPKSPLKRHVQEVAQALRIPAPAVMTAQLDNPGLCRGDTIYVDENYLHQEAPTPEDKKAVLAHEMTHLANRDVTIATAISMACDLTGASETPRSKTKRVRVAETFADVEAAAACPTIARAAKRLTAHAHKRHGDGVACTHPSEKQRKEIAALTVQLHEAEPKRLRACRDLRQKFNDAWGD